MEVGGYMVVAKPAIKYLEVITDSKLGFREHLQYLWQKVASATTAIATRLPKLCRSRSGAIYTALCTTCVGGGARKLPKAKSGQFGLPADGFGVHQIRQSCGGGHDTTRYFGG